MDNDTRGKVRHLGGRIREKVGEALGDRELERSGRLDQVEGQAEQDQERAVEDLEDATARRRAARRAKGEI
jgi:uncharacterized protein YjbJ (UPF0337 family)